MVDRDFEITMDVAKLIETIGKNRERHEKLYKEAMKGYKENLTKALKKKLVDLEEGKPVDHHISLIKPFSALKEYNRTLKMLKMTIDSTIKLNQRQFDQYVEDDWGWKKSFVSSCNPHGVTLTDVESSYLGDD